MSILVTGGAGFIGSHFIKFVAKRNNSPIVCLDNFNPFYDPQIKRNNAAALEQIDKVTVVEGDFCDRDLVQNLFQQHHFNSVAHIGGYAGVRNSVMNPDIYQLTNVDGTRNLLEVASTVPLSKFLFVSSSTVYGANAEIPFKESNELGEPTSPYGASKQQAEMLCKEFQENESVPIVCVRPFNVYGRGMRPDLAMSIFANMIRKQSRLPVFGDGTIRRDYSHVSDVCHGMLEALVRSECVGETINLGNGSPVTVIELIRLLEKALGKSAEIEWLPTLPQDLPVTFACLNLAKEKLDYEPKVSLEDGVRDYCDWLTTIQARSP